MGDEGRHPPRLHLDQLLDELQGQLDTMRGTQSRVHSLLEAVLSRGDRRLGMQDSQAYKRCNEEQSRSE